MEVMTGKFVCLVLWDCPPPWRVLSHLNQRSCSMRVGRRREAPTQEFIGMDCTRVLTTSVGSAPAWMSPPELPVLYSRRPTTSRPGPMSCGGEGIFSDLAPTEWARLRAAAPM